MSATRRRGKGVHLGYPRPYLKTKNTGTSGILANTYNLTTWESTATMIAKFEGQPRLCGLERTCWNIKNTSKIISVNLLVQCFWRTKPRWDDKVLKLIAHYLQPGIDYM